MADDDVEAQQQRQQPAHSDNTGHSGQGEEPMDVEPDTDTAAASGSGSSSSSSVAGGADMLDEASSPAALSGEAEGEGEGGMDVQLDQAAGSSSSSSGQDNDSAEEMAVEAEAGPSQMGKRVKVYELRDSSWFDRGTGHCKGVYDDTQDLALLIVEAEDMNEGGAGANEGEGGFLKEELLLSARVEKEDIYARQQDTLIVWTEPQSNLDIALSFQDPDGCEDIWAFITEVQRHLNNLPSDADPSASSPRLSASPPLGSAMSFQRPTWQPPTLANVKELHVLISMQSKSQMGRDKIIEHIIHEEWLKQLLGVFDQAEDLESIEDIHAVSCIVHILFTLNDNTILEYLLQDEVFPGILGVLEYDPDIPHHRAPYREHYQSIAKYREVVTIRDPVIQNKIHQTYRLHYLREVVLSRVLDEGSFGILNGFIFFNQVDIVTHVQNNDALLVELLSPFKGQTASSAPDDSPLDERKRDAVIFLHQLLVLSKPVQLAARINLYRGLIDRGLLYVCEWAFRRREDQVLHTASEILTFTLEHDTNAVRNHIIKEEESKTTTLLNEIIGIQSTTENIGLASHLSDSIRTLLDVPSETESFLQRKEGPIADSFVTSFYETSATALFKPISDLPSIEAGPPPKLPRHRISLLIMLIDLLSFCVLHHAHRASYFILSNPISKRVFTLLRIKDKPLRYAVLRYARTCFRTPNHFIHRYFVKQDLIPPLLELLEEESKRDNMLSSSCMDVLSAIRTENIKPILNYMFEHYRTRLEAIGQRPYLRAGIQALTAKWEQNNEPPPAPPQIDAESTTTPWKREAQEEDYFNASDEEDAAPSPAKQEPATGSGTPGKSPDVYRKFGGFIGRNKRSKTVKMSRPAARSTAAVASAAAAASASAGPSSDNKPALGLDYDDGSDSDGSNGGKSPRGPGPGHGANTALSEELEEDLTDVTMRMRAKRQREEDEEADFAGLFTSLAKGKQAQAAKDANANTVESTKPESTSSASTEPAEQDKDKVNVTTLGEATTPGKRLKLHLGFGKGKSK